MHAEVESNRTATDSNNSATNSYNDPEGTDAHVSPVIYDELRSLARRHFRFEREDHTLQPTALVHETFLRLGHPVEQTGFDRSQYFGFASNTMRRILVEHARTRNCKKRGHGFKRVSDATAEQLSAKSSAETQALRDALKGLQQRDPQKATIVGLRYFGGLTVVETAEALGISESTVKRQWRLAKAWLYQDLRCDLPLRLEASTQADKPSL